MAEVFDVELTGCRPEPLASYLKALGVLRLVAEQKDKNAAGYWRGDHFVLRSSLDADVLVAFFENEWRPTPIVAPWNGGSGFTGTEDSEEDQDDNNEDEDDDDDDDGVQDVAAESPVVWVRQCTDERLAAVRAVVERIYTWLDLPPTDLVLSAAVAEAREKLADEGFARSKKGKELSAILDKVSTFEGEYKKKLISEVPKLAGASKLLTKIRGWRRASAKVGFIERTRSTMPDAVVVWMDSVVAPSQDLGKVVFSSLLGSGANDGRLDFTKTTFVRLRHAFTSRGLAQAALYDVTSVSPSKGSLGMFAPSHADSTAATNPWDWLLALEGALMFAGASTKRLGTSEHQGGSFPFQVARMNTTSLAAGEDGRDELWLPLWTKPATHREIQRLFAEGRARVGEREAVTGLDFARAVSTLGVSRGIDGFLRVAMTARNGKAHYATNEGRYDVRDIPQVRLLDEIDSWFSRLRRAAQDKRTPARVARAARQLEDALFAVTRNLDASEALLALGDAERALGDALAFTKKTGLQPITQRLSDGWSALVSDSAEARLGVCLGQRYGFRRRVLPIDVDKPRHWGRADDPGFAFSQRPLVDNLHALLLRDDIEAHQREAKSPDSDASVKAVCRLDDIACFIDGDVDDVAIERWARAASLLSRPPYFSDRFDAIGVPATFAVLRLVHSGTLDDKTILKRTSNMLARACAGDSVGATTAALQRLSAVGRALPVAALVESGQRTRRIAAALAFPLTAWQRQRLENLVLSPSHSREESSQPSDSQMQQETA
jgi:CRISPR-associated protein Csx17